MMTGVAEGLAVQPFDLIKTRCQLSADSNPPLAASMRNIYAEGGIPRFYRGTFPVLASMVPKQAIMFFTYERTKRWIGANTGAKGPRVEILAALAASGPEALAITPFQVVKVRLQDRAQVSRFRHGPHAFATILRQEGPAALLKGFGATVARNSVWNSVYFPTTLMLQSQCERVCTGESSGAVGTLVTLVCGVLGGTFGACFSSPFDVVKSRMQAQDTAQGGGGLAHCARYHRILPSMQTIVSEEGFPALYKGFQAKVVCQGVGGGVGIAAFTATLRWLEPP